MKSNIKLDFKLFAEKRLKYAQNTFSSRSILMLNSCRNSPKSSCLIFDLASKNFVNSYEIEYKIGLKIFAEKT